MNVPTATTMATIEMAEHLNGGIFAITFHGTHFAPPTLSTAASMGTSAVFDLHRGERACQRKMSESSRYFRHDEISDVAADAVSFFVTTKMMSESTPGEKTHGFMTLNDTFVTDVVHTKRLKNVSPGVVDYYVRLNIPALYRWGVVEVLSSTFFNDILIQMIRDDGWSIMENKTYPATGFLIAKTPETAMGVKLLEWPKGAVAFPPQVHYNECAHVNKWSITQQFGSPMNDSIKVPGGEYTWRIRLFFGSIWFVQQKIDKIRVRHHGTDHRALVEIDREKRGIQKRHVKTMHEYGYPYI
jgi:hypothetical protein